MKKFLCLIALLFASVGLVGCVVPGVTPGATGKTTITFWHAMGGVNGEEQSECLMEYLTELDGKLPENHVLYVKMHTISNAKISVKRFQKQQKYLESFPNNSCAELRNTENHVHGRRMNMRLAKPIRFYLRPGGICDTIGEVIEGGFPYEQSR